MRVGQARKRDANEQAIVGALEAIGVLVWRISGKGLPDLLTFWRGRWLPVEIKRLRRRRERGLTPAQEQTYAATHYPVVCTIDEALALFRVT